MRTARTRASLAFTLTLMLHAGPASAQDPPTPTDIQDAPACHLLLSVTAAGAIELAQVAESNGSSMFDDACLNSIILRRFKPNARSQFRCFRTINR